jgi:hypothetical protein
MRITMLVKACISKYVGMAGELMTGGFLVQQTGPMVYGEHLSPAFEEVKKFAIKERDFLITQSFSVQGVDGPYCKVSGLELLISGRDTLNFYIADEQVAGALSWRGTPGVAIYRGNREEQIGWVEKVEDSFHFFPGEKDAPPTKEPSETTSALSKPVAAFTLDGDFINRRFLMKNAKGENVAKVKKDVIAFPAFDHYEVKISPGMDPVLVLCCVCIVDEFLEKEIKSRVASVALKAVSAGTYLPRKLLNRLNPWGK